MDHLWAAVFSLGVLCFLEFSAAQISEPCLTQIDSCTCRTKSGYVNLHALDQAIRDSVPYFSSMSDESGNTYYYNPCSDFSLESCHNVSGCQMNNGGLTYALGSQKTATFLPLESDKGNLLQYSYTSNDNKNRILRVRLICDYVKGAIKFLGEDPVMTYAMELKTKYACADFSPNPFHNDTTTPAMTTTLNISTTTPAECDCDGKMDITAILITVMVGTFCLCLILLVVTVMVILVKRSSQPGCTSSNSEAKGPKQYQKL